MKSSKSKIGFVLLACVTIVVFLYTGCPCGSRQEIGGVAILTENTTSYTIITPDADKDCHAKFTVWYRWMNMDRMYDPNAPDPATEVGLLVVFNSAGGTFGPQTCTRKQDEDGSHYYWETELDIGAKNEPFNPTHYSITEYAESATE